ncbi:tetratricopeptide repeat protein [Pelagibius sp.]|uniref:tetratricopeptide repeat protein n=1 Tax=Pelagibius sp. TaxID=1931238 RepID=UPI003B502858
MSYEQAAPDADVGAGEERKAKGSSKKRRHREGKGARPLRNTGKMIDTAREKIAAKRWKDAVNLLKRALNSDRGNGVAMALLSHVYMNQRKLLDVRKLMKRALEAAPMEPEVHRLHGKMLHTFNEMDAAANAYTTALNLNPEYADAYRDLAILLIDAGVLDQATEALVVAIKLNPRDAIAFYHLGLIKKMQGAESEAIDAYSMAAAIKPDYAEAHVNLGKIAIDHGKHELGEKACRRAIEADPTIAQAYVNLGMVLRELKKPEEALEYSKKGVDLDPSSGASQSNLGNVYMDLHRYREALACFRKAMEFQPSFATSYFNFGNALRLLHDLDKAHASYDQALALEDERGEFHHNKGLVYQEQGLHKQALEKFRLAHKLKPEHHGLEFSLARSLWTNGFFEESWEHFDAGLTGGLRLPNRRFQVPRWQGEDIHDKRILVWREQGVGDEIDFARRFQHIVDKAKEVVIESDKRLVDIFQRSFPEARFLPERLNGKNDWEREDCDLHLPAGNLMQYFPFGQEDLAIAKTYPEDDIEAAFACWERGKDSKGYLIPNPERFDEMAERLADVPEGPKIGICWRSKFSHRDRDIHYTDLEMWEPILKIPGAQFVNVQYDPDEQEMSKAEEMFGIKIHRWDDLDLRMDLDGAFALTAQLDLVVSTSSSPNRIADAMGTEVWLMMAGASRPDQPVTGDYGLPNRMIWQRNWTEEWPVLIERIARALKARVEAAAF